jgi:uncharacterized protein YjbI with pentapeptide repeats
MANPEHLEILKQGTGAWNKWRDENKDVIPDLSHAEAYGLNLSGVDLHKANLKHAILSHSVLNGARLNNANLGGAHLYGAHLNHVNLDAARLIAANLVAAKFNHASLVGANLNDANLRDATFADADFTATNLFSTSFFFTNLKDADFKGARIEMTKFNEIDLSEVKNLESVIHSGPSSIGIDTIYKSRGNIPEKFLRGCGVQEDFITFMRSLVVNGIEFYSCFISYSSKDEEFAKRLYADLQNEGVRCWFAPEDLKIGEKFRVRIDESIRLYDKLLLVLSENSVSSQWVEKEVETALEKEREQGKIVLFPVRLDDSVSEIKTGWAADVRRSRHIGDFTDWKNHDSYRKAFERLMRDLKAEASR